jgi:hypothetical protein
MLQYRKPTLAPLNEFTHPSHECSHTHATKTPTINNTRVKPRRFEAGFSTRVGGFHHAIYASQCAAILPSRESSRPSINHNGTIYVHILGPITSRREVLRANIVLGVAVAHFVAGLLPAFCPSRVDLFLVLLAADLDCSVQLNIYALLIPRLGFLTGPPARGRLLKRHCT